MTTKEILKIGFEPIPHFTVGNSHIYKLGRHRHFSISSIGTPNEMVFLCETDDQNENNVTDAICLHNYDYDGYLTKTKIETLINVISG